MNLGDSHEVTALLVAWSKGDGEALERLIPAVEKELRRVARRCLERERPDATLQTTALINEAYVRLIDAGRVNWQDRAHFFAACAKIMRRILIDYVRGRRSAKRGGGARPLPLEDALAGIPDRSSDLLAIDDALSALSKMDPRRGEVVELRFFGGLSVAETAAVMGTSPATVVRDWNVARLWLMRELSRGGE